jgi:histidinol phosphatase-like PHP family hydrolase
VVVVHGETIVEPVEEGTNKEAIRSEYTDILAHPGLILEEDIILAKENQKYIEITARKGHSLTNGHVAKLCKKHNVKMVLNTDSHSPENLITDEMAKKILKGAGLDDTDIISVFQNSLDIVKRYTI